MTFRVLDIIPRPKNPVITPAETATAVAAEAGEQIPHERQEAP